MNQGRLSEARSGATSLRGNELYSSFRPHGRLFLLVQDLERFYRAGMAIGRLPNSRGISVKMFVGTGERILIPSMTHLVPDK